MLRPLSAAKRDFSIKMFALRLIISTFLGGVTAAVAGTVVMFLLVLLPLTLIVTLLNFSEIVDNPASIFSDIGANSLFGGRFGGISGLLAGFVIGLIDGIFSGKFLSNINGPSTSRREARIHWAGIGALLGLILGPLVLGVYGQYTSTLPEGIVFLATCGGCLGLPGGAITGILFGKFYSTVMAFIVGAKD